MLANVTATVEIIMEFDKPQDVTVDKFTKELKKQLEVGRWYNVSAVQIVYIRKE